MVARPGPAPNNRRHGHGGAEWTDVPDTPFTGSGHDMGLPVVPGVVWFPQVTLWWEQLRVMPHCRLWSPTDWLFAVETAYLKQDFWREYFSGEVSATKVTELRRREDQMGMTREARRKLTIRYLDARLMPPDEQPDGPSTPGGDAGVGPAGGENVTDLADAPSRRARLAAG